MISKFQKTSSASMLIRQIKQGTLDFAWPVIFDKYPIMEVRTAIIERCLNNQLKVQREEIPWIEQRVVDLIGDDGDSNHLWRELLNWYVFNTREVDLSNRAIDFAIGIVSGKADLFGWNPYLEASNVLKIVAGRLEKTPGIYQSLDLSSLKPFLETFLTIACRSQLSLIDYKMIDVKRVIRCILAVYDWSFLFYIEKVLIKVRQRKKELQNIEANFQENVSIREAEVFLEETIKFIKKNQK